MSYKRLIIQMALILANLSLAFLGGWLAHDYLNPPELDLPVLAQAHEIVLGHAFGPIPAAPALEYGMIRGMLSEFDDPNTRFVEPPQHELETDNLEGNFGGIGVRLVRDAENVPLLYPFPEGPAAEAGVIDGDRLVAVDQHEVILEMSDDEIIALLRGPEGQRVRITVLRASEDTRLEFNIRRAQIDLPSVTWHLAPEEPRLGVLEINLIAASTPDEIEAAVSNLEGQGAEKYLLDLRDNGGGLLEPGVEVARLFLEDGTIMRQQFRDQDTTSYEVLKAGALVDIPLLVLINHGTASAAEIVAGALQTNGRAQLLGSPSYGKDSVQFIFDLQDGSSLHITGARWEIPGFQFPTDQAGLIPDFPLSPEDQAGSDPAIKAAIELLFGSAAGS